MTLMCVAIEPTGLTLWGDTDERPRHFLSIGSDVEAAQLVARGYRFPPLVMREREDGYLEIER